VLIRSLATILIVISSYVLVTGQTPAVQKQQDDNAAKAGSGISSERLRDIVIPNGVNLQYLIKALAQDMDLNVLFDRESFGSPGRTTNIQLKNVTTAAALNAILLQEGLIYEDAGPKMILVANRTRAMAVPQIGVGVSYLTDQLAQFFGVDGGILINNVALGSPASIAGLKAGDVIVEVDGVPVRGALGVINAINAKNGGDIILKLIRDRKGQTINLTPQKQITSPLPQKVVN